MGRILGIDLGTTNSAVAVMDKSGPFIVPNSIGERLTPSVVGFTKSGEILIENRINGFFYDPATIVGRNNHRHKGKFRSFFHSSIRYQKNNTL